MCRLTLGMIHRRFAAQRLREQKHSTPPWPSGQVCLFWIQIKAFLAVGDRGSVCEGTWPCLATGWRPLEAGRLKR